jgi:indole-3-glycerol phosphate synthase
MAGLTMEQAVEGVYQALDQDNEDIDARIAELKQAMAASGQKEAKFKPERLAQNNRQGRKVMQAYFKKRGVTVVFEGME